MDRLLGEHGFPADTKAGRREFENRMEIRRAADLDSEWRGIRCGWCLGDEEFREEPLAAVHCLNKKSAIGITTKELLSDRRDS